jgi:ATP-binding cassette subfamily G (WHITE) protein 2
LFVYFIIVAVALIVAILICVVMMMFSGFLIDLASVFNWLSWIKWISAVRYASNILTINEFQGLTFCLANLTDICPITGEEILDKRALSHADAWDLWKNFMALTLMAIIFFILAYIQLVRTKKTK